jgi:hypothetical protein
MKYERLDENTENTIKDIVKDVFILIQSKTPKECQYTSLNISLNVLMGAVAKIGLCLFKEKEDYEEFVNVFAYQLKIQFDANHININDS